MKDKRQLLFALFGILGYVGFVHLSIEIKSIFFIVAIFATIVYFVQSILNKYAKIHIIMSLLSLMLFISLLIHHSIIYKYKEFYYIDMYNLIFATMVVVTMFVISVFNYFKNLDNREGLFMKILIFIMIICIIVVVFLILLKKSNILPN